MTTIYIHELELPQTVEAQDHHEFAYYARVLSQMLGTPVKSREIGFNYSTGQCEGLVYSGRMPVRMIKERRKELEAIELTHDCKIDFEVFRGGSSTTDALCDFAMGRFNYKALREDCNHDKDCVKAVDQMEEEKLALGTGRRMARVFLKQYYTDDDLEA